MSREYYPGSRSEHKLMLYEARQFRCVSGVNHGEGLEDLAELCLGDVYRMRAMAEPTRHILLGPDPRHVNQSGYFRKIADPVSDPVSDPDSAGATETAEAVDCDQCLTVMTESGVIGKLRLLTIDGKLMLLPLGAVDVHTSQSIIARTKDTAPLPLADPTCLAFTRGTRITLQDGSLAPIEEIADGAHVLTRDGRTAKVVAVLRETVAATGRCARVVIREGAFANDSELVVAAHHKLFVPARRNDLDPDGPDRMEPAIKLVNGLTITAEAGGETEYFHLLLERHEVIYAEGIPCESLLLTNTTRAGLSPELAERLAELAPAIRHRPHPASLPPSERPVPARPIRPALPAVARSTA